MASRASRPIARLLALLGLATAQWTRRLDISLPGGVASIVFEEADDPDAIAARFVRERGVTDGAGCTADAACVAALSRAGAADERRDGGEEDQKKNATPKTRRLQWLRT